jgi:cytochrome c oxidase assembly factor CtaG
LGVAFARSIELSLPAKGTATAPLSVLLTSWFFEPVAFFVALVLIAGYTGGLLVLRRRGEAWSRWRVVGFYLLGVGSFVVVNLDFLGVYSHDLRYAFSTRTALLLFVVPALISLGRPLTLARTALQGSALDRLERFFNSRPVRILGNAMVSPLVAVVIFSIFLTPLSGILRQSDLGQAAITVLIPALGLLLILPLIENSGGRTGFFVTVEFLLAFVELVIDAVPGIALRVNTHILDGVAAVQGVYPAWFPSPLRDQQLSGDLLWFIAELGDIPVLILLFIRWSRVDKREAQSFDDLSDEEMEALTQAHLRSRPE